MRIFPQRWIVACTALALLAGCHTPQSATSAPAGVSTDGVAISHIDHRYIPEPDFQRISEYLTGKENPGGRLIERTDPAQRAGYYFILSLTWHPGTTLPAGTQAVVDYVANNDPTPRQAHFTFSQPTGTLPEILLGLTGKDWADKNVKVAAYKVTLKDAAGQVLASQQSFLWALPPEPAVAAATADSASAKP